MSKPLLCKIRWEILKQPDVLIQYEALIRDLLRVREKFGIEWDENIEKIMRTRDAIYERLLKEKEAEKIEAEKKKFEQTLNVLRDVEIGEL